MELGAVEPVARPELLDLSEDGLLLGEETVKLVGDGDGDVDHGSKASKNPRHSAPGVLQG